MDPTHGKEAAEESVAVPSQDPEKPDKPEANFPSQKKALEKQTEKEKKEQKELSEQDEQLKGELELLVERLKASLAAYRTCDRLTVLCSYYRRTTARSIALPSSTCALSLEQPHRL